MPSGGGQGSHGKRRAQTRSVGHRGSEGTAGAAVRKSPKHNSRSKTEISPPDARACGPRLLPSHCSALLTTQFPPRSPRWLPQLRPSLLVSRQLEGEKGRQTQPSPLLAHPRNDLIPLLTVAHVAHLPSREAGRCSCYLGGCVSRKTGWTLVPLEISAILAQKSCFLCPRALRVPA